MKDLTNQEQVVQILKDSKSEADWNATCDAVKSANGGYPSWWYGAVVLSGLSTQVSQGWEGEGGVRVITLQ